MPLWTNALTEAMKPEVHSLKKFMEVASVTGKLTLS
jgi:hypothetical protein